MSARHLFAIDSGSDPAQFARKGTEQIADTEEHIGPYYHAEVKQACVINTAMTTGFIGSLNGRSYPAGTMFRFQIDKITLTSGEVHGYLAEKKPVIVAEQGGGPADEDGGAIEEE